MIVNADLVGYFEGDSFGIPLGFLPMKSSHQIEEEITSQYSDSAIKIISWNGKIEEEISLRNFEKIKNKYWPTIS